MRRVSGVVVYLMVALIGALALHLNNVQQDRDEQQSAEQSADLCEAQQENRDVLRQVVIIATEGSRGGVNFEGVEGFADLDPAMQTFLRNFASATQPATDDDDDTESLRQRLLEQIPAVEC